MTIVNYYNTAMFNFRSKITVKILGYFFINPEKKRYINELAYLLEADPGNLFRKLVEMEKEGILFSETVGKQKFFGLNKKYPLLKELKAAYEAKAGFARRLKEELEKIKGIKEAFIYGSFAKGTEKGDSDIDLFITGSIDENELIDKISELEKVFGRDINYTLMTEKELKDKIKAKNSFLKNILSGKKIKLI